MKAAMLNSAKAIHSKLILFSLGMYLVAVCGACTANGDKKLFERHPVIVSGIIPKYYVRLFKPLNMDKLKLIESYEYIGKDTVSNFLYDGKYYLQIYKLSEVYNFSLKASLKESYSRNVQEVGTTFENNQISMTTIRDKMILTKKDIPEKIFISMYGTNYLIVAKNDSVADYYFNFKNLSIRYKTNGPQEIYAETSESVSNGLPLEIMLIKENKKLYLLFLSPKPGVKLTPKTLYNIIR